MKKSIKKHLLLEQLEERIFLDANPVAAVEPIDPVADPAVEPIPADDSLTLQTDSSASPTETASDSNEQEADTDQDQPETETTASDVVSAGDSNENTDTAALETGEEAAEAESADGIEASQSNDPLDSTLETSDDALEASQSSDSTDPTQETSADATDTEATDNDDLQSVENREDSGQEEAADSFDPTANNDPLQTDELDATDDTTSMDYANLEGLIDPMIGEDFTFTVSFDNPNPTDGDTFYGPYIDLIFDNGLDAGIGSGAETTDDGISFFDASYLGSSVQYNSQTVDASGQVTHNWATDNSGVPLVVSGLTPGDEFVTLLMPFGSFTPDQTAADVVVTALMSANADIDTALDVDVVTGAMFGTDPLDNPSTDNPLRDIEQETLHFQPEVIAFNTDIEVPTVAGDCQEQHDPPDDERNIESNHQEIPTGPNFPGIYVSTVDIADGQSLGGTDSGTGVGLIYTQHVPTNVFYTGIISVEDSDGSALSYTVIQQPSSAAGGDLVLQLNALVTGTVEADDIVIRYGFYVPEIIGTDESVLDPVTGDDGHVINDGEISYTWNPTDSIHDAPVNAVIDAEVDADGNFSDNADVDDISHAQSIAIQKDHVLDDTGAAGYTPDDILDYTLDFQISDYFSFGDANPANTDYSFRIDDTIANGLLLSSNPVIEIREEGTSLGTVTLTAGPEGSMMWTTTETNGDVVVHYNLHEILSDLPGDDILDGGYTSGTAHGPTIGKITYQATIQQEYAPGYNFLPDAEENIDQGDVLSGGVNIYGDIYDRDASSFTGSNESDESCDGLSIATGAVHKDIYAINGETDSSQWETDASGRPHLSPGDTISYHLSYDMPISSTEDFHLVDYLPLPIFDANDPDLDGTPGGWNQTGVESLDAGDWFFTPAHTYEGTFDEAYVDADNNALGLRWFEYHDVDDDPGLVDVVFTIEVSSTPFADGLFLTNQVTATEQGTLLTDSTDNAIIQIVLDEPDLNITKGVVETDNDVADASTPTFSANATVDNLFTDPGAGGFRSDAGTISSNWLAANDINTSLSNVDAGDIVTMAIVVENTGHSGAFDVTISDVLPTGYGVASNIQVTDGAGTVLTYSGDLFAGGITIDDGAAAAGLSAYDETSGTNILVITYDLELQSSVGPDQTLTNTATITNFAGAEGATDHTTEDISDDAIVRATDVNVNKIVATTSQTHTEGTNVTIGETVTYSVTITLPAGSATSVSFADVLDPGDGLEIISLNSLTTNNDTMLLFDNGVNSGQINTFDLTDTTNNVTYGANNLSFSLDLGTVTNNDRNNATAETITLTYTALVRNIAHNQNTEGLDNTAQWNWTDGNNTDQTANDTETITIVEPGLQVTKSGPASPPDSGDTFTYTLVIEHNGESTADAFDATMSDPILAGLTFAGNLTVAGTATTTSLAYDNGTNSIVATWDRLNQGQTTTISFDVTVDDPLQAGTDLTNTAGLTWTSLPDGTPDVNDGNERTGDGGVNDYSDSDTLVLTLAGTIDKLQPDPDTYTIGDTVTYDIVVSLPEGDTEHLVVNDVLPDGLRYVGHSVDDSGFNGTLGTLSVNTPLADGDDIVFDFAGTTNTVTDSDTGNNSFTIQVTALVTARVSNVQGQNLTNEASMSYDDPDGGRILVDDPTDPEIFVTEPQITTTKSVADTDTDPNTTIAEPGEALVYTVRFENTGDATAYEVNATDDLPDGVIFNQDSATAIDQDNNPMTVSVTEPISGSGDLVISGDWDIEIGDWIDVQYTVTVMAAGFTGGNHTNTVDADWSSQNGDDPNERQYDDTGTSPVDGTQDENNAAFTVVTTASLGDTVFFDADNSGGETAGDVGISGVDVTITADVDNDGTPEFSQTVRTDADGHYTFSNLAAFDDYVITVDSTTSGGSQPTNLTALGLSQTYDLDEDGASTLDHAASSISLTAGQHRTDVDFGYTGQNSVGDTVWFDTDNVGTQDANEGGINGLTVTLTADIDGDGDYEYTATTTTHTVNIGGVDVHGQYSFDHLPAGDFIVTVIPPASSEQTYDLDGIGGVSAHQTAFSLGATEDRVDVDFGYRGTGSIGDFVWFDTDADGNQNDGATSGIGDVDVTLEADVDGDGIVDYTKTTTTADDGSYLFEHLLGGDYTITVDATDLPAGMVQTYDWDDLTGPTFATAHAAAVTLASGANQRDVDFGYTGTTSVGDTVWFDVNNDGIQNPGEVGINNVTVTITADIDGDGVDEYTATTTTAYDPVSGLDGQYSFDNLPAGDYTITVITPAGSVQTYDQDDGHGATDNQASFTMDGATDRDDIDFGYRGTGSIGDFVWYDADSDGNQDDGPLSGLGGVTVSLVGDIDRDGTPDFTATTITNADGSYIFENLLGGSYTITVNDTTLPGGTTNWLQTYDLDDTTGPGFGTPHSSGTVDLAINGEPLHRTDVDFGYTGNGSIGDTVFYDADNSGSETAGDTGITNLLVTLTADIDNDGITDFIWTDTTDANGHYLFENLPEFGNYTVTVDPTNLPPRAVQTYDLDGNTPEHITTGIALGVAENRDDVDFGYISTGTGSIGDTVWYDADNDGIQDAGELGLAGVELTLTGDITGDGAPDVSFTTTTDANGQYIFDELLAGDYTVTVIDRPGGMEQTFDLDGLGTADAASLALADGENNNNVDFGYTGAADIGDTIYFDADNSGSENAGDAGIPGVTVTLTGDINNDGVDDVLTTTTDANGNYLFENLRDGDYTITVDPTSLPAGMNPTADPDGGNDNTSAVTLAGGVDDLDQDFGYTGTGTIGDTIWEDTDGDGTQSGGETGLAGVDVTLSVDFDGDGTPDYIHTVTTDGSGNYSFDNLPEGTYTIAVDTDDIPDGYILTGDPDSNLDSTSTVNLPAGGTNLDQDFGYQNTGNPTGSIGDTIYFDTDGDGPGGTDIGLSGVVVTLNCDIDGDGTPDIVTTTTDENGTYLFDNLPEGDYTVTVDPTSLPAGMTQTADPDGVNDNTTDVTLPAGENNVDQDFGYNGTGSIGDTIYFDGNNNGTQESNEGGIANVQVEISVDLNGDGAADYTYNRTTNADGTYLVENLPAGEYTITVDPASLPGGMNQSADPDSSLDNSSSYTLGGGENNLDQDFGYTGTGSIGDTIWNDMDGNGTQDSSEGGLASVAVTVSADIDGDGIPDYEETVTTDGNGNYIFENLPTGDYTITVDPDTLPAGMNQTGDPDGGSDNTSAVTLGPDEDNLDQDFGYNSGTGSIGDTIYFDVDGNGTQDGTESGLPGVMVTLTGDVDGDGTPDTVTTTTDSNGNYIFDNLPAGDYTITVDPDTLPAEMNQTGDPDGGSDNTSAVTLGPDEDNLDQDFGYQGTGSIGDTIWDDDDGDGTQDVGEGGLAGVEITLSVDFDGDGTPDYTETVTTDPTGNYIFQNLPEGEYTITVDTNDVPPNYVLTGDPDSNPDSTATVNLTAGEDNLDQDFGYHDSGSPTGSIGDTIYFDENNNGSQGGDDVGLPGVTVTLVGDIDSDGLPDTVTTTTDANGNYFFDNLPVGDYTITVDPTSLPAGMNPTADPDGGNDNTSTVNLAAGEDNDSQDFGYTGSGVIGDTIYFDTNGDGTQDSGENGMSGVGVTISVDFDGDGNPDYTSTTTTDANGNYSFDNLPAGEYTVTVDPASLPGDVMPSGDPDSTLDNSATVNLGPGATNNDQDFGYTGTGSIGDTIYFDADGNGYQSPGELGLTEVTVTLQGDFDNDGTIESVTTTTDAGGHYLFENLTEGDYTIYVDTTTLPSGMTQTGDPDSTLDNQSTITLGAGETDLAQDFGYSGPSPFPPLVPPEPELPVVPVIPPTPTGPTPITPAPITPTTPEPGLVADAFLMYRQFGDRIDDEIFFYPFDETPWLAPILPVSPIYTGHAEPGTTLQLVLYDAMGNQIGNQSVMADTAGNWLASFPGIIMFDLPHHMEIEQTMSTYNASSAGFFNMRTYFNPNFNSMVFSSAQLDVETIFAYLPSTVMQSMHISNLSAFDIKWNDFNGYEFLSPSTHPASNGH